MIWKTTLAFLVALFFTLGSNAQTPDLRTCIEPNGSSRWNCPSNNFTLDDVYLTLIDVNGNVIDAKSCTTGVAQTAFVYLNYTSNANSSIHQTRVFADLVIEGEREALNVYIGEVAPANQGSQTSQIYGPFTWECGTELRLENILVVWKPSFDSKISQDNYDCNSYGKSQCEFGSDTFIAAPLAVQFDYTVCRENGVTTVNYNSTTNGGKAPYTFAWDFTDNGSIDNTTINPQFTTTSTTDFTTELTVTDFQGTVSSYTVLINNPGELAITGDVTNINCDSSTLGSIDITISGGTDPFGVNWAGPNGYTSSSEDISNLEAGIYSVEVEDKFGCTYSTSFEIIQDQKPTAEAGNTAEITCSILSLQLNGTGSGKGTLSYVWTTNDGTIESGANTATPTVSSAGTYTLTITDADNGCSATDSVVITQDDTKPTAEAGNTAELTCSITSLQLDGTASSGQGTLSYAWTTIDGTIDSGANTTTPTVIAAGTYTLTVTDSDNGCSATDSVIITQDNTKPTAEAGNTDELTCSVLTLQLNGSGSGQGTLSYAWTTTDGTIDSGVNTATPIVSAAGTYTLTVTDADNGCFAIDTVVITEDILKPTAEAGETAELTCSVTTIQLNGTGSGQGALSYSWTTNDGTIDSGANTATPTVSAPGTYTLTVTDGDNGCFASDTVTVNQNIAEAVATITGNEILTCDVTSITLDASSSTADGNVSYSWSDGSTDSTLNVSAPGSYTVTVTGSNGCSDSTSVTVNQNITEAVASITGNETLTCDITSITLDASSSTADGNVSYLWSDGTTASTLNISAPGNYSVTITGENGCFDDASVTVGQNITPATAVITGNEILTCETTSVTLDAGSSTADGEVTYLWSNNSTEASITVSEPGVYSVTITGDNGCSAETSVTVAQNTTTSNAVITGNEILTCNKTSVTLDAGTSTADGEITYLWSNGANTAAIIVDEPGTYSVTITGENGCSDGASVQVQQNITEAVANISGNAVLTCDVTSVTLDASTSTADGEFTYLWSNGAITSSINVNEPGAYSVIITGENGCFDDASVTVGQNITPATAVITGNEILTCETTSVTLDAGSSTADGEVTYLWSNNSTEASITVSEPGVYSVTITGDNGCSDETSVTVVQNTTTSNAVITGNEILTCNKTSVTLDATTSTADGEITYLWSNGANTASITVDEPGTYSVTITGENGCSDGASVQVQQNITEAVANISGNAVLTCDVTSVTLDASTSTADGEFTYLWSNGETTSSINVNEPGAYSVTITGENGCFDEASVTVEQNINPATAVITGNEILTCETTSVTLDAGSSTADGEVTYLWSNNSNEASITVNEPGVYSVTITGENGCFDNASVTVEQNTTTASAVITGNEILDCNTTSIILDASSSTADGIFTYLWSDGSTESTLSVNEAGTYSVIITGENGCSNEASETVVFVPDTENPEVEKLKDISINVDNGNCSAIVEYSLPTSTDNCSGAVVTLDEGSLSSGSAFPVGTTTVNYTATDASGNTTSVSFTVTVIDNEAPVANVAELPTVIGECSATVSVVPTATDNCGGTINGTTPDALTYNEQGTYTVTWTFNDENGNTSSQTQTVIVDDVTAPVADVAELPTVTGECSATVSVVPTATDNCGGTINGTTQDALTYNEQGTYTVIWTFNDGNGNSSTQTQTVIVDDVTAPVADVAELPTVTGECSATVSAVPTATDNCGGPIEGTTEDDLTYTEQGTYTVTWTFNDGNGNTSTQTQTVIVDDVTAPVANVAELPTVTGECSATVAAVPTATDNCGGTINGTTEDALTYTEQGIYTVTWTFNDGNGNTSTKTQAVIVDDTTAPVANVAELPTVTGECSATVSVVPTATDNCGGIINGTTEDALTYTEQGTYTVTWTFNDGNGNTSTQIQIVIVDDVTAPVANVAELPTVTGECSATISVVPTATDNCGGTINGTTEDALTYTEQGTYTVTWNFNDGNGSTSTQNQTIIVEDVTAPVANVAELPTVTGECSATVSVVPTATDNCGGTINGTTEDALTYTEQGTYTVTWTFNDGNGNTSTQTQTVIVDDITTPVVAGEIIQPTCDVATGSFSVTVIEGLQYSINGTDYSVSRSFTGLAAGTYNVTARTAAGCVSEALTVTINNQPLTIETPVVAATIQPTCEISTGSFSISEVEGLEYSFNGGEYASTISFEDLTPGNYTVTARNAEGCVSEELSVTINALQGTPAAPITVQLVQPICDVQYGSFSITSVEGMEYSINGSTFESNTSFSNLEPGNYNVIARNSDGCVSEATSVTINPVPADCFVLPCELSDVKDSISKAVTPNGDGFNDSFNVGLDLECDFTYAVQIFNRWGAEIYKDRNYQNNWDGYSNKSITSSNQLPSGTYYYILEVTDTNGNRLEPIQGYIYLGTK